MIKHSANSPTSIIKTAAYRQSGGAHRWRTPLQTTKGSHAQIQGEVVEQRDALGKAHERKAAGSIEAEVAY